ncbi:NADH-quinone oxidoreductase subunit K [Vulcanibacillus modesticaldus]|uniref:NADH-quinone oxidoreductase subunit K n=1 Tax=Vulcanibacillus modesticaldus TaxID=337097 RepID=A0A1D2YVW0_9BACI|nr:NADH-quinone oxidoreductase subunit NuoK [Vulcanibacillus modesticaldus]OEF99821.1 NADH-quinone oxidoreductase subunit K [Vulcanibacillus modesticaldus]
MVPLNAYLAVGAIMFSIGMFGVLNKKSGIIVLLSIELMLNAVNINLIAFSRFGFYGNITGQIFTIFTITVAAAETAVGLAILIAIFRNKGTISITDLNIMKR